jgi:hypothetical protein
VAFRGGLGERKLYDLRHRLFHWAIRGLPAADAADQRSFLPQLQRSPLLTSLRTRRLMLVQHHLQNRDSNTNRLGSSCATNCAMPQHNGLIAQPRDNRDTISLLHAEPSDGLNNVATNTESQSGISCPGGGQLGSVITRIEAIIESIFDALSENRALSIPFQSRRSTGQSTSVSFPGRTGAEAKKFSACRTTKRVSVIASWH